MRRKYFLSAILSISACASFAQDSTAYQKFLGKIVSSYKLVSANRQLDFDDLRGFISKDFFNVENPLFIPSVLETKIKNNITERQAFDLLYENTMRDFRKDHLWEGAEDVYSQNKKLFQLYGQGFCACMNEKFKKGDDASKYREVFQICRAHLISDTTFLKSIKQYAGANTYNKLDELRNFTLRYLYGNCDILTVFFDDITKKTTTNYRYFSGVRTTIMKKGEDAIRFYRSNKLDSLKELFPQFEDYKGEFEKLIAFEKIPAVHKITKSFFGEGLEDLRIIFRDDIMNNAAGTATFITSPNTFEAKIKSLSFTTFKKEKTGDHKEIVEERSTKKAGIDFRY